MADLEVFCEYKCGKCMRTVILKFDTKSPPTTTPCLARLDSIRTCQGLLHFVRVEDIQGDDNTIKVKPEHQTYYDKEMFLKHESFMPSVHVEVCGGCGSMVVDVEAHDKWHGYMLSVLEMFVR